MLIGICGFIGSGKDTIADYFINRYQFKKESYAGTLKDVVANIFGWDRELIEGSTKESRQWREQVDIWWANELNDPTFTPRKALQMIGTDVFRNHFHHQIWILSVKRKLQQICDEHVVITDCRFPNEIQLIKDAGGIIIHVHRDPSPEWYVDHKNGTSPIPSHIHISEYAWIHSEPDYVIYNNQSLEALYSKIDTIMSTLN